VPERPRSAFRHRRARQACHIADSGPHQGRRRAGDSPVGSRPAPPVCRTAAGPVRPGTRRKPTTTWLRQPLGRAPECAARGVTGERIIDVDPSPRSVGGILRDGLSRETLGNCYHRLFWWKGSTRPRAHARARLRNGCQSKADQTDHRDGAPSNRFVTHAIDTAAPKSGKLEFGPESSLKNGEFIRVQNWGLL
jgi:hypothetical protein